MSGFTKFGCFTYNLHLSKIRDIPLICKLWANSMNVDNKSFKNIYYENKLKRIDEKEQPMIVIGCSNLPINTSCEEKKISPISNISRKYDAFDMNNPNQPRSVIYYDMEQAFARTDLFYGRHIK